MQKLSIGWPGQLVPNMIAPTNRRSTFMFVAFGVCLILLAITLNIIWVVPNWRTGVMLVLGAIFFPIFIVGLVLNTIFLVREIRRNEQHDAFLNAVTHELKTPVASIRLYLETLQSRQLEDGKRKEFYQIMLEDTDRLHGTIEQVLRAGSSSKPGSSLNTTRIDLAVLAQDCLALARTRHHLAPECLNYAHKCPNGESTTVIGDTDELKAAVSNLLDNAIKYSGGQVRVLLELTRPSERHIAVRIRDQGVGIAPEELKHVFKRFYRIPGAVAMRVKGTGLGLFIVQSVAKKHGGRVFAESEGVGRGSSFTMELPVK